MPARSRSGVWLTIAQIAAAGLGLAGIVLKPSSVWWISASILLSCATTLIVMLSVFGNLSPAKRLILRIFETPLRSRAVILILFAVSIVGIAVLPTDLYPDQLPSLRFYLPYVLLWPGCTIALFVKVVQRPDGHPARRLAGGLMRGTIIAIVCLALLEIMLQLAFNFLPVPIRNRAPQAAARSGVRDDTPHGAREYPAGQVVNYVINDRFGDLFVLSCLRPPNPQAGESYTVNFTRDDHGFRNPMPWPDDIELAVIGDSFVAAEAVQSPFWQGIAPNTLAFGLPGSGSIEQGLLANAFVISRSLDVVVLTYFEGNDLTDSYWFHTNQEQGETYSSAAIKEALHKPWEFLLTYQTLNWLSDSLNPQNRSCDYPIEDSHGNPLTFFDEFLAISTFDEAALRDSLLFRLTGDAILSMAEDVKASGGQFVLAFIPTAAHVHWSALMDAGQLDVIARNTLPWELDDTTGYRINDQLTVEDRARLLADNIDDQRHLMSEFAAENNLLFLDFTPAFQEATYGGESLYFYSDTHWNQQGHDLARQVLRDFLDEHDLLVSQ